RRKSPSDQAGFRSEGPIFVGGAAENIVFYGYLAALFFCEVKTGRRVAALGVAVLAAFNLLLWGM
ncbi:hypothetical protein NSA09_10770, partial [Adlercreutzia mucosicola]|uniref:hypothetical protein n=1 Tax=Adlercreutzia mucosicola TaxID=580026 RepID=UPI00214B24C7